MIRAAAGLLLLALPAVLAAAPKFEFSPSAPIAGEPIEVKLSGASPNQVVLVIAERALGRTNKRHYESSASFLADEKGHIDLTRSAPLSARWRGVDAAGLFWSMEASGKDIPGDLAADVIRFSADTNGDGRIDVSSEISAPKSRVDLEEVALGDEFPGAFLMVETGATGRPVIIVLGGSEGNDYAARATAPMFAARGYAVIGLPYYSPAWPGQQQQIPGLPRAFHNIEITQLEGIREWLAGRSEVDSNRVALVGVSKGAEFALAAASRIPGFAAIVAIVPSDVIWEGWGPGTEAGKSSSFAFRGEPLRFVPYFGMGEEFARSAVGKSPRLRTPHDAGRLIHADQVDAARIAVEKINAPVLVAGGDKDEVWDSGWMTDEIARRREPAGLETISFVSAEAGHQLSQDPNMPTSPANAKLRAEIFPAMLSFLRKHLGVD